MIKIIIVDKYISHSFRNNKIERYLAITANKHIFKNGEWQKCHNCRYKRTIFKIYNRLLPINLYIFIK